jgi:hypothetical protein
MRTTFFLRSSLAWRCCLLVWEPRTRLCLPASWAQLGAPLLLLRRRVACSAASPSPSTSTTVAGRRRCRGTPSRRVARWRRCTPTARATSTCRATRPGAAAVLTEIYLCNVCSCQEILRRNGRGQGGARLPAPPRLPRRLRGRQQCRSARWRGRARAAGHADAAEPTLAGAAARRHDGVAVLRLSRWGFVLAAAGHAVLDLVAT